MGGETNLTVNTSMMSSLHVCWKSHYEADPYLEQMLIPQSMLQSKQTKQLTMLHIPHHIKSLPGVGQYTGTNNYKK